MLKQIAQKVEDLRRLIDDSRSASFLLAVSGGMDSMCMADLFLKAVGAELFAVAHCNFALRGEESDGDEMLVRKWAEENDVRFFVQRFDTMGYAAERGISIEMAARDLRYTWFAELCSAYNFDVLVVAHNANDNAETLMLNLLRGTGLNGMHGMAEVQRRADFGLELVFRPLLGFTRKQIEGYVLTHRVKYRHDSSNFESDYKRNKIRNEVFPVFEKINPSFVRTLNREIGYFAEAGTIVEEWCRERVSKVVSYGDAMGKNIVSPRMSINIAELLATPNWRYLLYYILSPYGFNQQTLASLESLLVSSRTVSGKRFSSNTHVLLTGRDCLTVLSQEPSTDIGDSLADDLGAYNQIEVVRGPGVYNYNGRRFTVEILPWDSTMSLKQQSGVLIMDVDKMRFPLVCRRWRQGDWLIPLGMRGRKKVSDLFADLKYDALAKESSIIMVDTQTEGLAEQQHVAGLLGVRIDDRYKVTSQTRTVLRCSLIDDRL